MNRLILLLCAAAGLLTACREKKPAPAPPPHAAAPAAPTAKPLDPKIDENDPLTWPVELHIGKDGKAIPPQASLLIPRRQSPSGHPFDQRRFIQHTASSGHIRQPFKSINQAPKVKDVRHGKSKHGVHKDGRRESFDADSGNYTITYPDGHTETQLDGGGSIFTYPKETAPGGAIWIYDDWEGNRLIHYKDGTTAHIEEGVPDKKGSGGAPPAGGPGSGEPSGGSSGGNTPESSGIPPPGDDPPPGGGGTSGGADPAKNLGPPQGGGFNDGSGGPGSDPMSTGAGEPHYLTRDGAAYTTQAVGEFILVTGVAGREVQVRQQPWKDSPSFSAITALAFRVGESVVEIRLDGTVLLDGVSAPDEPMVQANLPGGGAVGVWRKDGHTAAAVVVWPDLSAAWITPHASWIDFHLQWNGPAPDHRGLLGSNDGNAANDFTDRQGVVHESSDPAAVAAFVNSWRLTDAESLFTYAAGESTATYTQLDFPRQTATATHPELAEECCGHLPEGFARERCFYDVAMTGDRGFAAAYERMAGWHHTQDAPAIPPSGAPAGALTEQERQNAALIESDATLNETLAGGESRVYRFAFDNPNRPRLGILSNELDPVKKYAPGIPAYALFNDKGEPIGAITSATNDFPMIDLKPGDYYLKITGPGLIHIKLH